MPLRYEAIIRSKLENIDGLNGVYGASVLPRNAQEVKPPPCVYLIFLRAEVSDKVLNRSRFIIKTYWQIQVVTRNLVNIQDGLSVREDSQNVINNVFTTLNGWQPDNTNTTALQYEGSPLPIYDNGLLLFPLNFSFSYNIGV
jgi:hypothetical protein